MPVQTEMERRKVSVEYLDGLWRKVITLMYMGLCAVCRKEGTQCHHVIMRADKRHRWHPLNGVLTCDEHHRWAHEKPKLFRKWLHRNLPDVYNHTRNPNKSGFDPKDREKIKENLLSALNLISKTAEKMVQKKGSRNAN